MYEIVNTGVEAELGTYTISANGELTYQYMTMIFYRTDIFNDEAVRLKIVRSNAPATPIYSLWVTPSEAISNFTESDHWLGDVRFDFASEAFTAGSTSQVFLETQNYTHSLGGTQIGAIMKYINSSTGQFEVISDTGAYKSQFFKR